MWLTEAANAQKLIDEPQNKTQDFSAYLIEVDTQRLLYQLQSEMKYDLAALKTYGYE